MKTSLKKNLGLFDVYAISTGAMFSSGFFLLPGIAASMTGPSAYMAYLVAGVLILPSMFCMAELSTAMPKAGGTYYFLDRALGPLVGTVGGLGSWVAVVFKSAFALVGMGAYLGIYFDVPITTLAIALTVAFGVVNIVGAKETTFLQRFLVTILVVVLAFFVAHGFAVIDITTAHLPRASYDSFFKGGFVEFVGTIGLVFVSYAGLTKVASVAEEVDNPDRNIPLGMILSLVTATAVYSLGMMVMINVLPPGELYGSLTPVADAAQKFMDWIPYDLGVIAIVVSAIAAFASTGNAGIMSASRYPFAMAKDKLMPESFSQLGRFATPTKAILFTVVAMIIVLLLFDVKSVAKLASAFQLLIFAIINLAVIVMRESHIESYKPGFKSPFYPWVQIAGLLISFWLIVEMGMLSIGFTGMVVIACVVWYVIYADDGIKREGAIYHVHARLGANKYEGLERELMTIIHDRTTDDNLKYEDVVARSRIVFLKKPVHIVNEVRSVFPWNEEENMTEAEYGALLHHLQNGLSVHKLRNKLALSYEATDEVERPILFIFKTNAGGKVIIDTSGRKKQYDTLMVLIVPDNPAGLDLRLAGHIAEVAQSDSFDKDWSQSYAKNECRKLLMRDDHFLHMPVSQTPLLSEQIGKKIKDITLPDSCLIALIERGKKLIVATPEEEIQKDDVVSIIGEPIDLAKFEVL